MRKKDIASLYVYVDVDDGILKAKILIFDRNGTYYGYYRIEWWENAAIIEEDFIGFDAEKDSADYKDEFRGAFMNYLQQQSHRILYEIEKDFDLEPFEKTLN